MKTYNRFVVSSVYLVTICCLAKAYPQQKVDDEVLATWSPGSHFYEKLSTTKDGLLIWKSAGSADDPDFYKRETVPLRAIQSIKLKTYQEDFSIRISTEEGAILRESHVSGRTARHTSEASWLFPNKVTAEAVFKKLKSLTGK
jgi:hypothetical protein